jgi:hypothetical protein
MTKTKTGGRIAGTPNRITHQMRVLIAQVLEQEIKNLPTLLGKLNPYQRVQMMCRLMDMVVPAPHSEWDRLNRHDWDNFIHLEEPQNQNQYEPTQQHETHSPNP